MPRYPNILCRVNTIRPVFVARYVTWLPKEPLSTTEFYNHVNQFSATFKNNHRQACLQWGLYYEENGMCYPRFTRNISEEEARVYIDYWLKKLVVPNPYSNLSQIKEPINLVALLYDYMIENPEKVYLHDIVNGACKERMNSSLDILKNTLEQTGIFTFFNDGIRFYRISPKNGWNSKIGTLNNLDEIKPLIDYFDSGPNESEDLQDVSMYVYGQPKSYEEISSIIDIEKVLLIEPVQNIKTTLTSQSKQLIKGYKDMNESVYFHLFDIDMDKKYPLQQITYGAPGTGKSHGIKRDTAGKSVIRTTFHPDSDYSTFVGAYKPVMEDVDVRVVPVVLNNGASFDQNNGTLREKRISYKFVKQAFLKAYLGAWKKYTETNEKVEPQFLIIEEINRGNCAQIFGDLFQLLDRNDVNNFSTYPIDADTDLQKEIEKAFKDDMDGNVANPFKLTKDIEIEGAVEDYTSNYGSTLSKDVQEGRVLLLPPNFYIWATMNTSDQSLFPIDSAFKRRWAWDFVKITDGRKGWTIKGEDYSCDWWTFLQEINKKIATATSSDDKKLGYFFCKPKNNETAIDENIFVSKVIFYLWNDVFKDNDNTIFKVVESNGEPSFEDFYIEDVNGKVVTNSSSVKKFLIKVVGEKNVTILNAQTEGNEPDTHSDEQESATQPTE